jgi:cytochrome b6-f complex iron-sulfur subunit
VKVVTMRGIKRYIEDLLHGRRPRPFRADPDAAALARTAVILRSARPGSGAPTEDFVSSLHKRLAAELDDARPEAATPARPRRTFLRAASVAAGAAAAGAGLDHFLAAPGAAVGAAPAPQASTAIVPDHGSWQAVLASDDLPDGAVHAFTLSTLNGFVERADGELRAISGICTHQGCRLVLADPATELNCPCHGAVFALDGAVLRHRLSVQLTTLPRIAVRESDGVVQVYAPQPPAVGPGASGE